MGITSKAVNALFYASIVRWAWREPQLLKTGECKSRFLGNIIRSSAIYRKGSIVDIIDTSRRKVVQINLMEFNYE